MNRNSFKHGLLSTKTKNGLTDFDKKNMDQGWFTRSSGRWRCQRLSTTGTRLKPGLAACILYYYIIFEFVQDCKPLVDASSFINKSFLLDIKIMFRRCSPETARLQRMMLSGFIVERLFYVRQYSGRYVII